MAAVSDASGTAPVALPHQAWIDKDVDSTASSGGGPGWTFMSFAAFSGCVPAAAAEWPLLRELRGPTRPD